MAGFFYVLAVFFLILKLLKVDNLAFLENSKDYLVPLTIGIVVVSYMFGLLARRLIPLLYPLGDALIKRFSRHKYTPMSETHSNPKILWIKFFQFGSDRLIKERDIQFNHLVLLESLVVGILLFGISFALWLYGTSAKQFAPSVVILALLLDISFFIAYIRQLNIYTQFRDNAFSEIEKIEKQANK